MATTEFGTDRWLTDLIPLGAAKLIGVASLVHKRHRKGLAANATTRPLQEIRQCGRVLGNQNGPVLVFTKDLTIVNR